MAEEKPHICVSVTENGFVIWHENVISSVVEYMHENANTQIFSYYNVREVATAENGVCVYSPYLISHKMKRITCISQNLSVHI